MFISQEEAQRRLRSERNTAARSNHVVVETHRNGRGQTIPTELKVLVGTLAHVDTQKNVAEAFDVPQSDVSLIKNGKVGGAAVAEKIEQNLEVVRDKAIEKLMICLGLLTPEKLAEEKARSVSAIAADMSRVVEKTLPRQNAGPQVQLVVYAPQQRDESKYRVIEVGPSSS